MCVLCHRIRYISSNRTQDSTLPVAAAAAAVSAVDAAAATATAAENIEAACMSRKQVTNSQT
jgi:hypothetical protein